MFRTSIGPRSVDTANGSTFTVNHWFDSFAQIHRFHLHKPAVGQQSIFRVTYNSRLTSDGLNKKIKETGKLDGFTFAAKYDPCKSLFQKVQSVFQPPPEPIAPNEMGSAVTLSVNFPGLSKTGDKLNRAHDSSGIVSLTNKVDASVMQLLDSETLEPIGLAQQTTLHPDLKGAWSASHAKSDPHTGDVYNYNLDIGLGSTGTYRIFRTSASTGDTSILATFCAPAAYIHSLFLTEHYVILCVWNSFYHAGGGATILANQNLVDSMVWNADQPATWFVVERSSTEDSGRGLVAQYNSDAFFAFHSVNAYEETSTDGQSVDVIADVIAYENLDCIQRFLVDNLKSDSAQAQKYMDSLSPSVRATYRRYRLPRLELGDLNPQKSMKADLEYTTNPLDGFELPVINPKFVLRKHRYIYGVSDTGKATYLDGLVRYDVETRSTLRWSEHGQSAGEAIFVADPGSTDEEAGVLLSVVLDGLLGRSYLLVLDARTMKEVGRAHVDGAIGFGFHGLHVNERDRVRAENGLDL